MIWSHQPFIEKFQQNSSQIYIFNFVKPSLFIQAWYEPKSYQDIFPDTPVAPFTYMV